MLDVLAMIEGYCHLLIERINLVEREKLVLMSSLICACFSMVFCNLFGY